jgi:ketosteroid isomerase-like protein
MRAIVSGSVLALAMLLAAGPVAAACPAPDKTAIEQTIRAMYAALAADDAAAFARLTAPDFYAYEGQRMTGPDLVAAIAKTHAAGRVLAWNLGAMDIHADCQTAWAAWENHGQVGDATAMRPMTWFESAALRRDGDHWVMTFLHATRVDPGK